MKVLELNRVERVALVALVYQMLAADGRLGDAEAAVLDRLADEMGEVAFQDARERARGSFLELEAAMELCARISRPEAQRTIRDWVDRAARADGLELREQALIVRLDALWGAWRTLSATPRPTAQRKSLLARTKR